MPVDLQYEAFLNAQQMLRELQEISRNITDLANRGNRDFEHIGNRIGILSGVVSSLTSKFIELGQQAVQALAGITQASIQSASELETTGKVFTGIFQRNEEAATAALARIRKESRLLGVDLGETAASFLPFVKSLAELSRVGKISAALTIAQPEQGAIGARIALQEALSGNVQSLVRRFEVPKEFAKQLQEALDTGGVTAFLDEFERVLAVMGRDLDNLGDTFQASLGKVQLQGERFQAAFGTPIIESLKEQFDSLGAILEERGTDFELVAAAFGDVLANVIDFVGSGLADFLANLDVDRALDLANQFFEVVEAARILADALGNPLDLLNQMYDTAVDFQPVLASLGLSGDFLSDLELMVDRLDRALTTAIQLSALVRAEAARQQAEALAIQGAGGTFRGGGGPTGLAGAKAFLSAADQAKVEAAGEKAFNAVILESSKILEESTRRTEENRAAQEKRREELEKSTTAGEGQADAFLAEQRRQAALTEALEAGAAAQEKINEETEEAELDHQRKLAGIMAKGELERLDQLEKNARKRLGLATKNLQEIEDIERKNEQAIVDAATDLTREEEDIARKAARERIQIEKEEAQTRVKAEEEFHQTVADIRRKFRQTAEDAERDRDAIAFLEAGRSRNREIEAARIDRDRDIEGARSTAEEKRATLAEQLEFEIEDAQIVNERKLTDLQTSLDRQLEAQQINYERQLEEQQIAEARQEEDAAESLQRQIDAANLANERKLADLQESLAAEYEAVKAVEKAKTKFIQEETKARVEIQREALSALREAAQQAASGGAGLLPDEQATIGLNPGGTTRLTPRFGRRSFHDGGVVPGPIGQPITASLLGGEIVTNPYRTPAASPVPLPLQSIQNISRNDNSLNVDNLNIGQGGDMMERYITYNEAVAMLSRLRSRGRR